MSDVVAASPADDLVLPDLPTVPMAPPSGDGALSLRDAAKEFSRRKEEGAKEAAAAQQSERAKEQPREAGKFAAAQTESTAKAEDAGPEAVPGESVQADPAETPPIEPPRSWSKEDKELFATLPPETQARVAERERARESDFLKRQNEAAEKSKGLTAKEQAAEQARQQYEQATQNALQVLHSQQASEFTDIKTDADVQKLATDDPFRFIQWQARQQQINNLHREVEQQQRQRGEEAKQKFETWSKEQDDAFTKQFPEFADKDKGPKVRESVRSYLVDEIGIPENGLSELWNNPLFRDAKTQRIMYDAARFREAQQKAKAAVPVAAKPVIRPGVGQSKGETAQADIAALEAKLGRGTTRDQLAAAAALRAAKRAALN